MSHKFLLNSSFHKFLNAIDHDLSEEEHTKGCSRCGGSLHRADYPRSPVGVPREHREHYQTRYSHCCSQCRKRTTPQSIRFFGRRWFPAPLFILISALMYSGIHKCCRQLKRLFGISVSKRTCKRWKDWWESSFIATNFWKGVIGIIPIDSLNGPFPQRLFSLCTFTSGCSPPQEEVQLQGGYTPFIRRLVWMLKFLAPLTAGVLRAV
jgi:hypothetical protein